MKNTTRLEFGGMYLAFVVALIGWVSVSSTRMEAQMGNNAVYDSTSACCAHSPAFIDAGVFATAGSNFCGVVKLALTSTSFPSAGGVVDARGLNSGNTSMACTSGQPSPWTGITSPPPSTILLPAGTIVIPGTWILPSNTHLIGEGDNPTTGGTILQATNAFAASSGPVIQFGPTSCSSPGTGISIEQLIIDGLGGSINGITNSCAADDSYVDHVSLYQIRGTGLTVSGSATNSGPYSNISFDTTSNYAGTSSTVCAQIYNVTGGTRGIHGLSCHTYTNDPPAAVLLDSSNNTIEDVTIIGFYDGILVGGNGSAQNNVLMNIVGDTSRGLSSLTPVNAVHISNNNTVTDLSIVGVSNSSLSGTYTIQDELTSAHLLDNYVALYAIGGWPILTSCFSTLGWGP